MRRKISHTENAESTEKPIVETGHPPRASAWGNEPGTDLRAGLQPGEACGEFASLGRGAEAPNMFGRRLPRAEARGGPIQPGLVFGRGRNYLPSCAEFDQAAEDPFPRSLLKRSMFKMTRPDFLPALVLTTAFLGSGAPPAQAQNLDHLSLMDSTMAIVRNLPAEDLQAELDAISTLLSSYERNKRDADHHKQLVLAAVEDLKKEIEITKAKSELAKKEERTADRDSLELLKKALEVKRSYFERTADVRETERRHAEALVEWTKSVRTYFEKGVQLMEERDRDGREHDLLTLEREMIAEQKAAASRLQKVADEMSRLANRREDLYKEREKLRNPK